MLMLASCLALVCLTSATEKGGKPQICSACAPCSDWKPPSGFNGCPPCCNRPINPPSPPRCAAELCAKPRCYNPITLPGQCCPVCPRPSCRIPRCVRRLRCSQGIARDLKGCLTCRCNSVSGPRVCPRLSCAMLIKCAYGQILDRKGCPSCRCKPGPGQCNLDHVTYRHGARIPVDDPCQSCTCRNGRRTCRIMDCPPLRCSNPIRRPGQCCPQCPVRSGCQMGSMFYAEGAIIPMGNPCESCSCRGGRKTCALMPCPPSPCSNPIRRPGQCCPQCPAITGCMEGGVRYAEGASIPTKNPCEICTCRGGRKSYTMRNCPGSPCSNPIRLPGQCCPQCPAITGCLEGGVRYAEGASIPTKNPCEVCTCRGGRKSYTIRNCPPSPCSNPIRRPGQCCSQCPGGRGSHY